MADNFKINGEAKKGFTKILNDVIRDEKLTSDAYRVISFLFSIGKGFHITTQGIAKNTHMSENRVKKAIKLLKEVGYVSITRVRTSTGYDGYFWNINVVRCNSESTDSVSTDSVHTEMISDTPYNSESSDSVSADFVCTENIPSYKRPKGLKTYIKEKNEIPTEEDQEREFTPTLTPLNQSGESVISSGELNIIQAFNRFCEVYPKVGDRDQVRAAFFAIPDINKICHQIVNSVEWFEKSGRWNDWKTGQKNVSCPQAIKFLTRGDWQEYLKSGATMSEEERLMSILNKSRQNVSFGGTDYAAN